MLQAKQPLQSIRVPDVITKGPDSAMAVAFAAFQLVLSIRFQSAVNMLGKPVLGSADGASLFMAFRAMQGSRSLGLHSTMGRIT